MSNVSQLASLAGVLAAGEFSYRGDRFSYEGLLETDQARLASIMCRANTLAVNMQTDILESFKPRCGCLPPQGWFVRGGHFTVCVVANLFCFLDNASGDLNQVTARMRELAGEVRPGMV
jgi:roadblock/LC7 domain-containing protein